MEFKNWREEKYRRPKNNPSRRFIFGETGLWSISFLPKVRYPKIPHKVPHKVCTPKPGGATPRPFSLPLRRDASTPLRWRGLTLAPLGGGGGKGLPVIFWEFRFETCHTSPGTNSTQCVKNRSQVIIGQPWVTSEWRHVSPILTNKKGWQETPPRAQLLSYNELSHMVWLRISSATKLVSWIFFFFWKFGFFLKNA